VPVERVKEYQAKLTDYLTLHKPELLQKIAKEKVLSDTLIADLKDTANAFKQTWR
jgi:F0F1-type ATP synthase alpha subunit